MRARTAPGVGSLCLAMSFAGAFQALAGESVPLNVSVVALRGQPAPGPAGGQTFYNFREPAISNTGLIAFAGDDRLALNNTAALWWGTPGALSLVARSGTFAPADEVGSGVRFSVPILVGLNDAGQLAWRDRLRPQVGATRDSIWRTDSMGSRIVVLGSTPAPGVPGGQFGQLDGISATYRQVFNSSGHVGFYASINGDDINALQDDALWTGSPDVVSLIAREGSSIPGAPVGAVFGTGSSASPYTPPMRMNGSGTIAFTGRMTPSFDGLWKTSAGTTTLVVGTGTPLPGVSSTFNSPSSFSINNTGDLAFSANYGSGLRGVWRTEGDTLRLVAHQGQQVPGLSAGVSFASMSGATIDGAGRVYFESFLTGPGVTNQNNTGLFAGTSTDDVFLVAREGDIAPGTAGEQFTSFSGRASNSWGATAFSARFTGETSEPGLWVADPALGLLPIAVPNTLFEVAPGDSRLVARVRTLFTPETSSLVGFVSGGQDGLPISFNDLGQVAFALDFADDSSGVFVATVPAPSTCAAFVTLMAVFSRRRRRRTPSC